jgi:hypothetical protein
VSLHSFDSSSESHLPEHSSRNPQHDAFDLSNISSIQLLEITPLPSDIILQHDINIERSGIEQQTQEYSNNCRQDMLQLSTIEIISQGKIPASESSVVSESMKNRMTKKVGKLYPQLRMIEGQVDVVFIRDCYHLHSPREKKKGRKKSKMPHERN